MQPDVIEKLGNNTIQHGKYNNRIYLMKAAPEGIGSLPDKLEDMARQCGYSKIFAKVPASLALPFVDNSYQCEAQIPQFFNGTESVLLLSLFLDDKRKHSPTVSKNEKVLELCRQKQSETTDLQLPQGAELRVCTPDDAGVMADLYSQIFPTYPFPIDDAVYIRQTMASHCVYFGIWENSKLIALSSAEMDTEASNVEMTDFATLPQHRRRGLASILLKAMEAEMRRRRIATAYTIARAASFGMNITFARMGYSFGGRLINNTNIGGQFEDMNIWYKSIPTYPSNNNI